MTVDTKQTRDPLAELDAQARASYDEGDLQVAKQVWEAILQMSPEHEGALRGLDLVSRGGEAAAAAGPETGRDGEGSPASSQTGSPPTTDPEEFNPVLLAGLARAREKMDAGDVAPALALLDELANDNPDHPELLALRAQCGAHDSVGATDLDLQLDLPAGQPAPMGAGSPAAPIPDPSPGPDAPQAGGAAERAGGFDLDLELPGAETPVSAPIKSTPDAREFLDAVGELGVERPVEGLQLGADEAPESEPPGAGAPANEEVTALVAEARDALSTGDTQAAMQIAARAMAIDENAQEAASVLEEARSLECTRHEEAERYLTEAISEFEQGAADKALPLLESVLQLVPGHAEAEAYIEKARRASSAASSSGSLEFDGSDLEGVEAVPLGTRAGEAPASTGPVGAGYDADTGPAGFVPTDSAPPPAVDLPMPGASTTPGRDVALPPPPPTAGTSPPAPPSPPATPVAPAPPVRAAPAARSRGGGRSRVILLALIAVVALGAGGWYAVTSLGLLGGGEREIISAPHAAAPLPAGARETAEPGVQRTIPAVQPGEEAPRAAEARSVASAQAPSEPRYTRADVPRLVAQADRALSAGNPRDAVELLVAAQAADPVNFDLIERLEAARSELNAAKEAQSRLEAGRVAFRQGQFDEALRIFYRVPAGHRPPQLDSWIALGWYNLGVRSLQTGNTHEALQFFNDSLDHAPGDPLTARNREVAIRYTGRKRDEAYRIYVQSLRTRKLPE